MSTGADLVAVALKEVGYTESRGNATKYGRWYGLDHQPWCAMFVAWCADRVGRNVRTLAQNWAYTPSAKDGMARHGLILADKRQAQPGDIVFFDFPDRVHRIQHVGIVADSRPTWAGPATVEGNTSSRNQSNGGMVMRRSRTWSTVAAVGRLPWDPPNLGHPPAAVPPSPSPAAVEQQMTLVDAIRFCKHALVGDGHVTSGPAVTFVQTALNRAGMGLFVAQDGQWGPHTRDAVIWYQTRKHLVADGVVGPATWEAMYPGV